MPSTVRIKLWWIEHDNFGRVYLGPYFTEQDARDHNFKNDHDKWGRLYEETQEAEICQVPLND